MPLSKEMRKLAVKWGTNQHWPKRLENLEIHGIRGWEGQRIDLNFPLVAIVGENGVGKSTILQAIASLYRSPDSMFASDFFPDTPWDTVTNAVIKGSVREGQQTTVVSVRKPTDRWRGNPERRQRDVKYIDLRRIQPITARIGYSKIAKSQNKETKSEAFDPERLGRFSAIIGRPYNVAGFSLTDFDDKRWVPVVGAGGRKYSGFHQGAGEMTITELLKEDLPKYAVILIDEFETSLHPRSQRRLVRDLAEMCRLRELQIIVTTHSPYVLDELPPEGRIYVMNTPEGKSLVTGVSPYFAMTQMDEEIHPEADVFVEDERSQIVIEEIIISEKKELLPRCSMVPFGAASVGQALGQMASQNRFPRPSVVFLDGDAPPTQGCHLLPGDDAPERVVFEQLKSRGWESVAARIARSHSDLVDASDKAMTLTDHHDWIKSVADRLIIGSNTLWRAMVIGWVNLCLAQSEKTRIVDIIHGSLEGIPVNTLSTTGTTVVANTSSSASPLPVVVTATSDSLASPNDFGQLFPQ